MHNALRWMMLAVFIVFSSQAVAQTFGTVNFDFDSAELDATALAEVQEIAERLKATTSYKPSVVVGYTDAVGSNAYNDNLGLRRAQAVANALIAAGAPVDRVGTIESRGKRELLVAVATPERANRRVTVGLEDILAACRSYRDVALTSASVGAALQTDIEARLSNAVTVLAQLQSNGSNGAAYQMAGAAREDCGIAAGYIADADRKVEYAKRCFCNAARLDKALGN